MVFRPMVAALAYRQKSPSLRYASLYLGISRLSSVLIRIRPYKPAYSDRGRVRKRCYPYKPGAAECCRDTMHSSDNCELSRYTRRGFRREWAPGGIRSFFVQTVPIHAGLFIRYSAGCAEGYRYSSRPALWLDQLGADTLVVLPCAPQTGILRGRRDHPYRFANHP